MGSTSDENHGSAGVGRRDLIKRSAALGLISVPTMSLLSACASGGGGGSSDGNGAQGQKSKDNPFGAKKGSKLDVMVFKGGYGDDYAKAWEADFDKKLGITSTHTGTQEITGKLQPRLNASNPPDIVDDSGAQQIKIDVLYKNDALLDLSEVLDAPSVDDPGTKVRDTLIPGTLDPGVQEGKVVALNYIYTVWGLWYSGKLFQEKGWQAPKTWDDFLAICQDAKKQGIGGLAHQGKYPYYINVAIMDLIAKKGGIDAVKAIDNLDPKAFVGSDAAQAGIEAIYEVVEKGLLMPGTNGLTHTESQTRWNQYKAAFITCGSWLENEQLKQTPADFDMKFLPMPLLAGSKMPFEAIRAGSGEPFIIPAKAGNLPAAKEFMRRMLSREWSTLFAKEANSLTILKDGVDASVKLRPGTQSTVDASKAAGSNTFRFLYPDWYSEMDTAIQNASNELMAKRIQPKEWLKRCQAAVDKQAKDPASKKNHHD
ncbi:carbohydrate ABC transporter, N-acetylglucosamine/diacetylchitobiose-binding protein [Streptomyces pluripotens]|uniref:Carbohydrate ABC transporter, N-acetylglucosamine/diacetylchitobiose-binding protein n=1 Tax=Streptomyces pluripotens TaxID=1355015 RepID=A0A221P4N7_9ACTN|nr:MULTISPECIES: N-acetylglucosamine/diacetylchitobiose ABC transporter substrate-binding protein [Streptomyces]ARP72910.1 carbohydrate ABC transporter, N-acetylglucosamine/diacetylchitobiose-binding protein [Streptomyces pluripotens]ASN27160.1 carbohydrate ABC transporter, N-acetylglucosamine/diacetylchitobiose-binding protein [Streptomyces pluripotens]KIE28880.1 sugar ABC transporter substrate-binding protein [Streptomyces sp. MUSC 125]MCH0561001.1 carbohydrate ABC transporter, N-acetylglucos